jgi:hypothetical protein
MVESETNPPFAIYNNSNHNNKMQINASMTTISFSTGHTSCATVFAIGDEDDATERNRSPVEICVALKSSANHLP